MTAVSIATEAAASARDCRSRSFGRDWRASTGRGSRAWDAQGAARQSEISSEYPTPYRRRYCYSQTIDTVVVKIVTDNGLVGFGEAKAPVAPRVTKAIIDELLAGIVIGEDLRNHLVLWERMYAGMRVRGHRAG